MILGNCLIYADATYGTKLEIIFHVIGTMLALYSHVSWITSSQFKNLRPSICFILARSC